MSTKLQRTVIITQPSPRIKRDCTQSFQEANHTEDQRVLAMQSNMRLANLNDLVDGIHTMRRAPRYPLQIIQIFRRVASSGKSPRF